VLIWKKRIVGVAGKEGEDLGLLGLILVTSLLRGVAPRVSRRLQLPHLFLACIHHLFPFPTVGIPAQHGNVNACGLVTWSCGAPETQMMQWTAW
jgi:hypothetical protein